MPSDLWRFLPLAVFLTCLAEMVLLPTRFFFASAISTLLSKEVEDTCVTGPGSFMRPLTDFDGSHGECRFGIGLD